MSLRKRDDTGDWKRRHEIAVYGEMALVETVDLLKDKLRVIFCLI